MKKEFPVKPNMAVGVFLTALTGVLIYYIYLFINGSMTIRDVIVYGVFMIGIYIYFFGCRPTKYVVENKKVISVNRLAPAKELDLMTAELITDAVPRLADLVTRPHAIEVYNDSKKRYKYFPIDVVGFTSAVVSSNKRIHCTVAAYTDIHRSIEKRERKERKRAERREARARAAEANGENTSRRRRS